MKIPLRLSLVAAAFTILLTGCGGLAGDVEIVGTVAGTQAAVISTPQAFQMPVSNPDLLNGQRIYAMNCMRCHGENGAGNGELVRSGEVPTMPSFLEAQHVRQQSPRAYYEIITNGNLAKLMPPWSDALSVQERWDVAMFVYTLHYSPALLEEGWRISGASEAPFRAESDAEIVAARGEADEDAYAVAAYERILSTSRFATTRGIQLAFLTDPPTPTPLQSLTFSGSVSNGTAGSSIPAGLPITLRYGAADSGVQIAETVSDANGHFRFEGIPWDAQYHYFAVANYQGRGFVSPLLGAHQVSAENDLSITLYETTTDASVITLTSAELVADVLDVEGLGTGLVFAQLYRYENTSDRMFLVTPTGQDISVSLLVQLPVASVVIGGNDPRYLVAQEQYAIVDTLPVYPGEHTVEILYFVPYEAGAIIDLPLNNALAGTVDVYLADDRLSLSGEGFTLVGETEVGSSQQTQQASHYRAGLVLNAGDSIVFDINGDVSPRAVPANTTISVEQVLPVILIGIGVALLFGIAFAIGIRARTASKSRENEVERLIEELAQLEDLHTSGRINHDYYQQRRQSMRQKLAELMASDANTNES